MRSPNEVLERGGSGSDRQEVKNLAVPESVNNAVGPALASAPSIPAMPFPAAQAITREFTSDWTHGFVGADHAEVVLASDGLGWTSTHASRLKEREYQRSFSACPHVMLALVLDGPTPVWRRVRGAAVRRNMVRGNMGIIPGGVPFEARLELPLESVQVYLHRDVLREVAQDLAKGDPEQLEILPRFPFFDPLLEQLARGICEAAERAAPSSALYVDHLARALAARMVEKHSTAAARVSTPASSEGLSERQLRSVTELIEANLSRRLSLDELAGDSRLSPGHFARLFKKSTGLSPYQFVVKRRVERVQRLLLETDTPIAEIAFLCGFANQVHLTQAFRRLTGATPAAFRNEHRR